MKKTTRDFPLGSVIIRIKCKYITKYSTLYESVPN